IVSKVFVKSLARADAALNAVIRNSRWPGSSKLFWSLFAGEACGSEVIVETNYLYDGGLRRRALRSRDPVTELTAQFVPIGPPPATHAASRLDRPLASKW